MAKRKKEETMETGKELTVVNAEVGEAKETPEENAAGFTDAEFKHIESDGGESLKLNIEAELFSGLRAAFNTTLQALLEKVTSREVDEGEVNLKLTISLENQNVLGKNVVIPSFKHVVTGNYKEKIESKGSFGIPQTYLAKDSNGEYELKSLEDNLFSKEPIDAEIREVKA